MAEENGLLQKIVDVLPDAYKEYIDKEGEKLIADQESGNFQPFSIFTPFIPPQIKKVVFDRIKEESGEDSTYSKFIDDYQNSFIGKIDMGVQQGTAELGGALAKLPAYGVDIVTDILANDYGIGEATQWTDAISKALPKIESQSTTQDIASLLTQFALPSTLAFKIGNSLYKIKELNTIATKGGKAAEIAKRAGWFGVPEAILTGVAVNPETLDSISTHLGVIDPYDKELSGAEKAKDELKRRFVFGLEAGALTAALPVFGILAKTLGQGAGRVGLEAFQAIQTGYGVVANPVTKLLAKELEVGGVNIGIRPALSSLSSITKNFIVDQGQVLGQFGKKINMPIIPPFNTWRDFSIGTGSAKEKILKTLDTLTVPFREEGFLKPMFKQLMNINDSSINSTIRFFEKNLDDIGNEITKIAGKYKDGFLKTGESTVILEQKNLDVFRYFNGEINLNSLDKELRGSAKNIKDRLTKIIKDFAGTIEDKEIGNLIIKDANKYLKLNFASLNDASYVIKPELREKAVQSVRQIVSKNGTLVKEIRDQVKNGVYKDVKTGLNQYSDDLIEKIINYSKGNFFGKDLNTDELVTRIVKALYPESKVNLLSAKNIPETIQQMLGKTKDYRNAVLDTAMMGSKAVFQKKFGDEALRLGIKDGWVFPSRQAALVAGKKGDFIKVTALPSFTDQGAIFKGTFFVPKAIGKALMGTQGKFNNPVVDAMYKQMMSMKSASQYAKTILSPTTQIRNVTSGPMMILQTGMFGSKANILDHARVIANDLFPKGPASKEFLEYIEDGVFYKIFDENVVTQELRTIFERASSRSLSVDGFVKLITESRFGKKATDLYQAGDSLWKTWLWKAYDDMLGEVFNFQSKMKDGKIVAQSIDMKAVKSWFKNIANQDFVETSFRTGVKKTPKEILQEASAFYVTNLFPTYSKVGPFIRNVRTIPFIGNFVAFPAEMIRVSAKNLLFASRELASDNPVLRQNALKRLFGSMAANYGVYEALSAGAQALTGITQEQMDAYRRSFSAPYQKNSQLLPVSAMGEDGNFKVNDFSFFNPVAYNTVGIRAILNAYNDGKLNEKTSGEIAMDAIFGNPLDNQPGILNEYLNPFFGESLAGERFGDVLLRGGSTRSGKKVFYPTDDDVEKIDKGINHVIGAFEPGFLSSAKKVYYGVTETFTEYGSGFNTMDEVLKSTTGFATQDTRPLESFPFLISSYQKDTQSINGKYQKQIFNPKASVKDRVQGYADWVLDTYKSQNNLYRIKQDALTMEVDEDKVDEALDKRLKTLSEPFIDGTLKAPSISEARQESLIETMQKTAEVKWKKDVPDEALEKLDEVIRISEEIKDAVDGFELGQSTEELKKLIDEIISDNRQELVPEFRSLRKSSSAEPIPGIPNTGPGITISPPVSQEVVSLNNPLAGMIQGTGLTATENAYLSDEEKAIKMRQRGIG